MITAILGWYALTFLVINLFSNIGSRDSATMRVWSVILVLPLIAYVAINLFN